MPEIKKNSDSILISSETQKETKKNVKDIFSFKKFIEKNLSRSISRLLEAILNSALFFNASDIHFEPGKNSVKMRIRIDGVLHDVFFFDLNLYQSLLSRIKFISNLKLNVKERPQDGRFSILTEKGEVIEVRTSSVPSEYGETIVLRILNPKQVKEMKDLGLRKDLLEVCEREIKKPNGMILVAGPTGSGKTTTLYAFLKKIANPEIKIITIEDPIEYHLEGISQTQVDKTKGYDFANGLKAIVRQDPDVILVGEIRDSDTAKIAVQASLTGHLVLSTLHTNDAINVVARLQSLGEKPENIAPSLNLVIGQRLVRRVCQKCAYFKKPSEEDYKKMRETLSNLPQRFGKIKKDKMRIPYPNPKGCQECGFIGYKGRIGIFELFAVDDELEKFILKSPSIVDLKEKLMSKGMVLMRQDGFLKVLEGITTIEEIERIIGE